ncbi:GAD-like domain-containing protein [Nocardia sp. NPDC056000]|uniref:GAD-like domain-containing protein n=1 Tax=Nocardia sp. NPDC056000 TaxID=3345674 RepID=UPI0035E12D53
MVLSVGDVVEQWGNPSVRVPVPPERFEKYRDVVPEFLLRVWRELGFSGFLDGLVWVCDPDVWQPVVDEWTAGLRLSIGSDEWIAVSRSAFGQMQLWGRRTGMSLMIIPHRGWYVVDDCSSEMSNSDDRDLLVYAALVTSDPNSLDIVGDDDKPLFSRVLRRLGPVGAETMYGFVPAAALGGSMLPRNIEILDAAAHMKVLSDVTPRSLFADLPPL